MSDTSIASPYSDLYFEVHGINRRGFDEQQGKSEPQTIWDVTAIDPYVVIFGLKPGEAVEWVINVRDRVTGRASFSCRVLDPRVGGDRIRLRAIGPESTRIHDREQLAHSLGLDPNDQVFWEDGISRSGWYKGTNL